MSAPGSLPLRLEIGCGTRPQGRSGAANRWMGVDLDPVALADAREAAGGLAACADARWLPVRSGTCEELLLRAVLHHLVPIESALAELGRVATVGATVTIVDGTALDPVEAEDMNRELRAAGLPEEPVAGFDVDRLQAQLTAAGFEIRRVETVGTATFATPPFVSRTYSSDRFRLTATKRPDGGATPGP